MNEPLQLRLRNSFEAIPPANEAVTQWLESRHAPPAACYLANLAIEELVTNCVKYGYEDNQEHVIEINLSVADGQMTLTISDDGLAFNPLEAPEPDTNLPLEARPVGGLGLHLVRKLADHMSYERHEGRNRLTVIKDIALSTRPRES
jgi:anti-sigma regulatory factor (Ser/Thr protein kinase)